ncbi:MAG: Unknown protein [uncultured Sulfurovum sp.]|uniref:Type II/III secretion system secretin-like domain-containing protein n=1 Tax=uncultured Sulfurovum sp. TaxID=269237 RepID=A0A6S6SPI3_9BACT|nr:MAG: Unknown protein [uncultured Sulfurovum sp.]
MNKYILLIGIILAFGGCSSITKDATALTKDKDRLLYQEKSYLATKMNHSLMDQRVSIHPQNKSIYNVVKNIARSKNIHFDTSFRPSNKYKVTLNFNGTLSELFSNIYDQTGVKYAYKDGLITVINKKIVEVYIPVLQCKGKPTVSISLVDVPKDDVFKHFSRRYDYSFSFDYKYEKAKIENSTQTGMPKEIHKVSFLYNGCDTNEALRLFAKNTNLDLTVSNNKKITVSDYKTINVEIPSYYDVSFSSSGTGIGEGNSQGTSLTLQEKFKEEFTSFIKTHLSSEGTAYISNRGYIVVTDRPNYIGEIKELINNEVKYQKSIKLKVSIIRIDVNNEFNSGIDWNVAIEQIGKQFDMRSLTGGMSYADTISGGFSLGGISNNKKQLIRVLEKFGSTKIVKEFRTQARGGVITTFKAVEQIPYVTTSVVQNQGSSEVVTEAKVAEAGMVISIVPTFSGDSINLATDITISSYLGDKQFNVNGGEYILPRIAINKIQMPASVKNGNSVVLTGLKMSENQSEGEGMPLLIQNKNFGSLFGSKAKQGNSSEFLIIITPEKLKGF